MAATLCGQAVGMAADTNIDDIEDGDNTIGNGMGQPMPPTRVGYWFTYNETTDGSTTCKQTPPPDPSGLLPFPPEATPGNGSLFGAHTHGTGCTSKWGAGLGVDFNNCNMKSNPYDGSAYKGISFWYKSTTPIRVLVGTLPNLPTASGGTCASDCYNHHGKNFAASTGGTTATITWAELMGSQQIGSPPANPQTSDLATVVVISAHVRPEAAPEHRNPGGPGERLKLRLLGRYAPVPLGRRAGRCASRLRCVA